MAAAGLWTTPSDLAVFAAEMANAYAGKSSRVIERSTAREMLTRQSGDYGLGFGIEGEGPTAIRPRWIERRLSVHTLSRRQSRAIVMTNSDNGSEVAREIIDHIASTQGWQGHSKR